MLKSPIDIKIRDSINAGRKKIFSILFYLNSSIRKLDKNAPKKNEKRKYIVPFQNSKWATSLINRAKWPVTFVVNCLKDKNPVTFTMPATKE